MEFEEFLLNLSPVVQAVCDNEDDFMFFLVQRMLWCNVRTSTGSIQKGSQ